MLYMSGAAINPWGYCPKDSNSVIQELLGHTDTPIWRLKFDYRKHFVKITSVTLCVVKDQLSLFSVQRVALLIFQNTSITTQKACK